MPQLESGISFIGGLFLLDSILSKYENWEHFCGSPHRIDN